MDKKKKIEEQKKQEALIRQALYSSDEEVINETLRFLREKGNVNIVPDIINLYKGYKNTNLGKNIFAFLSDVKYSDAADVFVKAVENPEFSTIRKDLISLMWQSRLDFSKYFDKIVEWFLKFEIETAFEAFTIVEYLHYEGTAEKLDQLIDKVKNSVSEMESPQKKELLVDLVNILKKKKDELQKQDGD